MGVFIKIKSGLIAAALTAAAFSASGASAATILSNGGVIDLTGNSGTFTASHDKAGAFTDIFTFSTGDLGLASATVSSIRVGKLGDMVFSSIKLDGNAFTPVSTGAVEFWSIDNLMLSDGAHNITLTGSSNATKKQRATYSGTLDIAAVPEPATWGMMLLGFGLVGSSMRSRKRTTVLA